jgi:hypothetical protein
MANITRTFTAGRMNKVVDERLIPDGEYIDALNIRMGSTEKSEIGVIENAKGNLSLTQVTYIDGTPLSSEARTIGAIEDGANETIYWFIHDSAFPLGATGKLDMIVSFNVYTGVLIYHVISIDDGGGVNTTLNFDNKYLITGVSIVDNLLFFTDDYNPPRFINRKRNYANPILNIDQFSSESILVIKKPPTESPAIQTLNVNTQYNFMDTRYLCFAYRYKYADNEYSATSQFSAPAFIPKPFEFSIDSYLNEGMVNAINSVNITYNSGGPLVVGIDLLFKEAGSNTIKVIEKIIKSELGLADNTDYTFNFTNSKIFTVLPEYEILRLYDNVPLLAKSQTLMGNRLMYGNYVEGYDLIDVDGNSVKFEYQANLISNEVDFREVPDTLGDGTYGIDGPQTIPNSILYIDLTDAELITGSSITFDVTLSHQGFSGDTPFPTETSDNIEATFSFFLSRDYSSVYELATSVEFQDVVGTISNITPVYPAAPGGATFTDQVNDLIPMNLDALTKYASGISGDNQPITIITTPGSNLIGFQFTSMRFVDNTTTPTFNVYEYYSVTFAQAFYQKINTPRSLHSNRGYEIGIVYMDEFNRATTALVSPNNTVYVPCSSSNLQNQIQVTIPIEQKAPYWAKRYKFVIKPDEENYDTIYSSVYFDDPASGAVYFLVEGENAKKVEQGDRLIVKADTNGPTKGCLYATVLEKEAKAEGFITIPSTLDPTVNIDVPSGVYMKINPNSFSVVQDELAIISPGPVKETAYLANEYPVVSYPMNRYDSVTSTWVDYDIPAGSRIKLSFKFQRLGSQDGNARCEKRIYTLEKTLSSSANYANMKDWWDGENVQNILNDGIADIGAGGTVNNVYLDTYATLVTSIPYPIYSIPTSNDTNYYQFYRDTTTGTNALTLLVTGTNTCGALFVGAKRRSTVTVSIEVFRADNLIIFETEPQDALPDVFFENDLSFPIDEDGNHQGNVQDQDIALGIPAIVDTNFFNCFCFGNGAESYKIRDSIIGRTFNLGNRVTSVSAQDYKEADRFADMTYSGVYNDETNVNKLNEFNLGLLNFKPLEDSFGPIFMLDGRETDVLVLQEDKISYVLAGKNLLSDSTGGGAISSVPEVLGTQIARVEKYGISFNPESYVQWGYDRFFTDVKRGAVIQLRGNSYTSDVLKVVSESGMRTWFRDTFIESFNTQKLGGFDPYLNEYVLCTNDRELPQIIECVSCGISQVLSISAGDEANYCVDLGPIVGNVNVRYEVSPTSTSEFIVNATYNNVLVTSGVTTESGFISVDKSVNNIESLDINIVATDDVVVTITVDCPVSDTLTIIEVCVTNDVEAGKYIHNEYRYTDGTFTSPLQSNLVTFASGTASPLVSRYNATTGYQGTGGFPTNGSNMRLASNKIGFDDFVFDVTQDKFRYYRSNVLYNNTPSEIQALLVASTNATPISGASPYYYADFTVPSVGDYLYLIWDYRNALPIDLCYSTFSEQDACCDCKESGYGVTLCYSNVDEQDACCNCTSYPESIVFTSCYVPDGEGGQYYGFRASQVVDTDLNIDFSVSGYSGSALLEAGSTDSFISNDIILPSYPSIINIDSVTPSVTATQSYVTGPVDASTNCEDCEPPNCTGAILVFQVCNSNASKDDNFDVYLNDVYIGALDLNAYAQVGSVFIANLNPALTITDPDFICPLTLMDTYRFDPSIVQANNVLELRNTQINFNGNFGNIGVRNYQLSGTDLINPCQVANYEYSAGDGESFKFYFNYESCCPTLNSYIEYDLQVDVTGTVTANYFKSSNAQDYTVDWGDGSPIDVYTSIVNLNATHTYTSIGNYTIKITSSNALAISEIELNYYSNNTITDIRNISTFTGLNILRLYGLGFDLSTIDPIINLYWLFLYDNKAPALDLTSFTLLYYLYIDSAGDSTLTSVNLNGLVNLDDVSILDSPGLTSVDLTGLNYVKRITMWGNALTTLAPFIDFFSLNYLEIGESTLTSIDISDTTQIEDLSLYDMPLNTASVDNALVTLDLSGILNGGAYVTGTGVSAPSATGLAAKASLISKGWTVITN